MAVTVAATASAAAAAAAQAAAAAAAAEIEICGVKMARPIDVRYEIIKATKFGFQQKRSLWVNEAAKCIRFLDGSVTKTEFPFSQLQGVLRQPMDDLYNTVTLMFTGGARNYRFVMVGGRRARVETMEGGRETAAKQIE
jgi:hypothetical protein